jgi:hypothetical protein
VKTKKPKPAAFMDLRQSAMGDFPCGEPDEPSELLRFAEFVAEHGDDAELATFVRLLSRFDGASEGK